jgi:4-amino-4-deoxy-L-arabinose transferase-like glycosyltransferase
MAPSRAIPLVLLLAVAVRLPFWIEALRTPVDGDTAIVGLMARHPGVGTTLWGQPYGSPLDAWVATPFVAAMGTTPEALRLPVFLLGLLLVPLAYGLARALHPEAALPAGVLMACPPPYFLLLASLPPPLYATTLLLCGALLLLAARLGGRLAEGRVPPSGLVLAGAIAGLALWTHLMSASVVAVALGWLVAKARGRRAHVALLILVPLCAVSSPLWTRTIGDRQAFRIVQVADRQETTLDHVRRLVPRLHEPIGGLLGAYVPVVADSEEHVVASPRWAASLLVFLYGILMILAVRAASAGHASFLFLLAAALALLAFPFPVRSGPHTIRFLTPLYLPIVALVAWAPGIKGRARRSWIAVLALAVLHLVGGIRLLEAWRELDRADAPFLLPDLAPALETLESHGVRHALASYGPAWRLTWESGERVIASQPWNERFRHYPLPLLDEVRFARNVAWVLTPSVPTDLPPPEELEAALRALGGRWRTQQAGPAVVFDGFVPPYSPRVESWPEGGALGDGDLRTFLAPDATSPLLLRLPEPRSLEAVTLVAALDGPRLPRSMDVAVSADGERFETVARRRRRQERLDLRWLNGHPQAVLDHDLIAIPLAGRTVLALRVEPVVSSDPWRLAEVLLHVEPGREAWDEWLPPRLDWDARRRALVEDPLPDREDWYARLLLAARHRPVP